MSMEDNLLMNRLDKLLLDEAIEGLDSALQRELRSLLQENASIEPDGFMTTAGLVQISFLKSDFAAHCNLPGNIKRSILDEGQAEVHKLSNNSGC